MLAITPFYYGLFFAGAMDLRAIRVVRLFRLFHIFKLGSHSKALSDIIDVVKNKKSELYSCFIIVGFLILVGAFFIYAVESPVQPEQFPNVLEALWWSISTITFIYYNDVSPVTHLGKILAGIISLLGMLMVALPMGIICSGFESKFKSGQEKGNSCPHCGKIIEGD